MTADCKGCGHIYILPLSMRRNRLKLCPGCKEKRHAQQKLDSQRKRNESQRRNEMHDISAQEIEQRFQAALKEARRQSNAIEPFRSYGWLYREPRS